MFFQLTKLMCSTSCYVSEKKGRKKNSSEKNCTELLETLSLNFCLLYAVRFYMNATDVYENYTYVSSLIVCT